MKDVKRKGGVFSDMNSRDLEHFRTILDSRIIPDEAVELLGDDEYFSRRQVLELSARALATERLAARRSQQGQFDPDTWSLDPDRADVLREELAPLAKRAELLHMFDSYVRGQDEGFYESRLYMDQWHVMRELNAFLQRETKDHLNDGTLRGALTKGGFARLATAWGKTLLIAEALEAFAVDQNTRALVLVPSKVALQNIQGRRDEEGRGRGGLAEFAPDIAVSTYYEKNKDLSGDAIVMTYSSFRSVMQKQPSLLDKLGVEIIFCDESHHIHGEVTANLLEEARKGRITIGLSAVSERAGHSTDEFLDYKICEVDPRTLIEGGRANGQQIFLVATGENIETQHAKRLPEFSARELQHLRMSERRNTYITDLAAYFVEEEGRSGIINCIPGDTCAHAIEIAERLSQVTIFDWQLQHERLLRAAAVGSFLSDYENDLLKAAYEKGELDILTNVDLLAESFDSARVGFIINARPAGTEALAIERFGRGMRLNEWGVTVVVDLVDRVAKGGKVQYTALHVLGEEVMTQGALIAPREMPRLQSGTREDAVGDVSSETVPFQAQEAAAETSHQQTATNLPASRAAIAKDGTVLQEGHVISIRSHDTPPQANESGNVTRTVNPERIKTVVGEAQFDMRKIRELLVTKEEYIYEKAPDGWIPLASFREWGRERDMDIQAVRNIVVQEGEMECRLVEDENGALRYYVPPEATAFLESYQTVSFAPKGYDPIFTMIDTYVQEGLPATYMIVDATIKKLKLEPKLYRAHTTRRRAPHYSPAQKAKVRKELVKRKEMEPKGDSVSLSDLARELGHRNSSIRFFLEKYHDVFGEQRMNPETNNMGIYYTKEEADLARAHYGHDVAPRSALFFEELKHRYLVTEGDIRAGLGVLGLQGSIGVGRRVTMTDSGEYKTIVYGKYLLKEDGEELVRWIIERQNEAPRSKHDKTVKELVDHLGADVRFIRMALKAYGESEVLRKISRFGDVTVLSPRICGIIERYFSRVPQATEDWITLADASERTGIEEASLREILSSFTPDRQSMQLMYTVEGLLDLHFRKDLMTKAAVRYKRKMEGK